MNKINAMYLGNNPIILHCSTFTGVVNPKQIVFFDKDLFKKELLNNKKWKRINNK